MEETVRAELLADPSIILNDQELMDSLLAATDIKLGSNVVDLRHVAMNRLSDKLGALEGTHQSVVAAAYQNLLGTKQIHQAVIQLLGKKSLEEFVISLKSELLKTLSVDCIYILLEKPDGSVDSLLPINCGPNIQTVMQGFVKTYITQGGLTELSKVKLRKATSVTTVSYTHLTLPTKRIV